MAEYKRDHVDKVYKAIAKNKILPVYLIIGDRFLCRQIAKNILDRLIPDKTQRSCNHKHIDGDRETPLNTLAQLKTYNLFPGRHVFTVTDSKLFHSKVVAESLWNKAVQAKDNKKVKQAARYLLQFISLDKTKLNMPEELIDLSADSWQSSFAFAKPTGNLNWIKDVLNASDIPLSSAQPSTNKGEALHYMDAFSAGIPENNILILVCEEVDKRKKIYKFIKEHGSILDLSVASGSSKAAKTDQENVLRGLINKTLAEFNKTIEARAIPVLLERIGFHPVALVRETEKLALYTEDNPLIRMQDLDAVIGRTREDAIFELTEAYIDKKLTKTLLITTRMIESGIHPLIIISALRKYLRKMLLISSFRQQQYPVFIEGMTFASFQKGYLSQLKETKMDLMKSLPNHPYALFMMFEKVKKHPPFHLMAVMKKLLEAELRLKTSSLPGPLILEFFFMETLLSQKNTKQ